MKTLRKLSLIFILIFPILNVQSSVGSNFSLNSDLSINATIITSSVVINNNIELSQFISSHGFTGSGTKDSPYLITNLEFNIPYTKPTGFNQSNLPLITLQNTDKYVTFTNCSFTGASYTQGQVEFNNVSNIDIRQSIVDSQHQSNGLIILNSKNIVIKDNHIINSDYGILIQTYSNSVVKNLNEKIDVGNNYLANNKEGIFLVDQNYVSIHDNYFEHNLVKAIDMFQSNQDGTISNIFYNIFDSNFQGISFHYFSSGYSYITYNHFFNQSSFSITFLGLNNASISFNNFIYNNTDYNSYAITSAVANNGISVETNFITVNQGNNATELSPSGFYPLYKQNANPLLNPVIFNVTINDQTYLLPFFTANTQSDDLFNLANALLLIVFLFIFLRYRRKFFKKRIDKIENKEDTNSKVNMNSKRNKTRIPIKDSKNK